MAQVATWTTTYHVPDSLLSDTEDSIVGTEWHQEAIWSLADMLRDVAVQRGAAWGVCEQVALVGLRHEDGTDYDPRPDVMVLRRPLLSGNLASVRVADVGAPLFVMEVASESTQTNDRGDKRQAYAAVGVAEYIVFDPSGDILPRPLLAWRLSSGTYVPWHPDEDGWWHSSALDVSLRATQLLLGVRDRDGTVIAPTGEVRRRARNLEQRLRDMEQARVDAERARDDETRRRVELEEQLRRLQQERDGR